MAKRKFPRAEDVLSDSAPSTSKKSARSSASRYDFSMDDDDFQTLKKGYQPINTVASTQWAVTNFQKWLEERQNSGLGNESCPDDILECEDDEKLSYWLAKFTTETRKENGSHYPPRTLNLLLMGLQRHIWSTRPGRKINLLSEFHCLQNVCDSYYRKLHAMGIGTERKVTEVFDANDEDRLWSSGTLNLDTPQGLLNAVFFYNGKNFCLHGGAEHRDLKFSQIKREVVTVNGQSTVCYKYVEHGSKNRSGGLKQLQLQNKEVHQYENPKAGNRCHVEILDRYYLKVPAKALDGDAFYLKPLPKKPEDPQKPWFIAQPVGKNSLNAMVKTMAKLAGIDKKVTNHSLRAYGTTQMFRQGVPEKLIQHRTGHRSVDGLRQYERVSEEQQAKISHTLATNCNPPASINQQGTADSKSASATAQQLLDTVPMFSGCSFQGCQVQIAINMPSASVERSNALCEDVDLGNIDIDELFKFD